MKPDHTSIAEGREGKVTAGHRVAMRGCFSSTTRGALVPIDVICQEISPVRLVGDLAEPKGY